MATEEKHKSYVVALLAVFSAISFFAVGTISHIITPGIVTAIENVGYDEDSHVDQVKPIDPNKQVGAFAKTTATSTTYVAFATSTQYVLMAFDGSKSIQAWEDTLNFAKEMKAKGFPVHFSYFINAVYLLSHSSKDNYVSPTGLVAGSAIGFSDSQNDVADRVVEINRAIAEGHEIGSHTAGHNDGSKWTYEEWSSEFDSFNNILLNYKKLNPNVNFKESLNLSIDDIVGFRAPNLGVNKNLYKILHARNFLYDCSQVAKPFSWPFKDTGGLWHIPLGVVTNKYGGSILAMDYNWWFYQTGARDTLKSGTKEWQNSKDEVVKAYKDYFDSHYNGNRSPLSIGHHFSMWNDGVYWAALKEFAEYACSKPNVKCVSHKEFVHDMEGQ